MQRLGIVSENVDEKNTQYVVSLCFNKKYSQIFSKKVLKEIAAALEQNLGKVFVVCKHSKFNFNKKSKPTKVYGDDFKKHMLLKLKQLQKKSKKSIIFLEIILDDMIAYDIIVNKHSSVNGKCISILISNFVFSNLSLGIDYILPKDLTLASMCISEDKLNAITIVFRKNFILDSNCKLNENLVKYINETATFMLINSK